MKTLNSKMTATMSLRFVAKPIVDVATGKPGFIKAKVLQQLFETREGRQWIDVPLVEIPKTL
jgi:hypothetical protein